MAPKTLGPRFATQPRIALPGSERLPFAAGITKPPPSGSRVTVSVILRSREPLKSSRLGPVRLTRAQYRKAHGADPAAVKLLRAFASEFGLTLEASTSATEPCTVKLTGTVTNLQKAFGATLVRQTLDNATYRVREGVITLPAELAPFVVAVLGLDNRPQAKPYFRIANKPSPTKSGFIPLAGPANISYTPVQVAQLYRFPQNVSAAGQTIGIIELGGGYRTADITAYFKSISQKAPKVTAVLVDNGKNSPTTASSADGEVMLDIEVSAAVAPGANIVVYFAPNTDQGFIDAISTAIHDTKNKPSVISISWGAPESAWTQQAMTALDGACQAAAALGVTITAASGDNGSTDGATGNNVDFPSSSPHVLACGGTKLIGSASTITSEVVWNEIAANEGATGGGVSNVFPLPTWQANANVPAPSVPAGGRGVPDVSGNADPATGYIVRVDGQTLVIGGTSAVAPLWAGLIALSNARNKNSAGFLQPQIYAAKAKSAFNDITVGDNGAFSAGLGWDACTGFGSPNATALIKLLGTSSTGTPPTKPPTRPTKPPAPPKGPPQKAVKKKTR